MTRRPFGIETEFAVSLSEGRAAGERIEPCEELMRVARLRLAYLPMEGGGGIFLSNGSRLYRDVGGHLELATCEVDSPDDLVRYASAGDAIVASLAEEFNSKGPARRIVISKHSIDYLQPGISWAQHESFSHAPTRTNMADQLIPHLVSRIYCFAGGLNPLCPGIQFTLSPRMHIFCKSVSDSTTSDRGIFNTRDESLAGNGSRRLHVICADPLNSLRGLWLRVATTAVVVAMAEAGLRPAGTIRLKSPVAALHAFATDPLFKTQAELVDGRRMTLIEIQRQYLECAFQNQNHSELPPWTGEVCRRWAETLELLARGPAAVEGMFDWSAKYPLFMAHARRRGVDPESFALWNHCLTSLRDHLRSRRLSAEISSEMILKKPGLLAEHVGFLAGSLAQRGLRWEQVSDVLALRNELCEIDLRFGQIAPPGLFSALQENLRHRVVDIDGGGDPRFVPPKTTRARLRGTAVRRYTGQLQVACDWSYVRNGSRVLDLSDPLGIDAQWTSKPREPVRRDLASAISMLRAPLFVSDQFDACFSRGEYDRAYEVLRCSAAAIWDLATGRAAPRPRSEGDTATALAVMLRLAMVQARRGFSADAVAALERRERLRSGLPREHPNARGSEFQFAVEHVCIYRHRGLVPGGPELAQWIELADRAGNSAGIASLAEAAPFIGYKAFARARSNRQEEACGLLLPVCENESANVPMRVRARNMAELGEIFRAMGRLNDAARWLERAEQIQTRLGFFADIADYTHTCRFKCDPTSRSSTALLRGIKRTQHAANSRIGLTRTMLLEARYRPSRWLATRRRRMIVRVAEEAPDLMTCQTLTHILEHWPSWVGGCPDPAEAEPAGSDPFWGL
ncbi:MAG: proteasome accessory factor PafA2 family protein [Tepidisphaeraceae bacterium]|jgi:proteasome accessory factor A